MGFNSAFKGLSGRPVFRMHEKLVQRFIWNLT